MPFNSCSKYIKNGLLKSDHVYHLPIVAGVVMLFHSNVTLEWRLPGAQPTGNVCFIILFWPYFLSHFLWRDHICGKHSKILGCRLESLTSTSLPPRPGIFVCHTFNNENTYWVI